MQALEGLSPIRHTREGPETMKAAATPIRVGLIIPSSNVTIEAELPALLTQHMTARFTFHSSRMRMQAVSEENHTFDNYF
jgi:maleate cis-trans isomerase